MIYIFYIIVFFSSLLLADMNAFTLLNVGPKMYISDLFFIYAFVCTLYVAVYSKTSTINKCFLGFLVTFLFAILHGLTRYGFAAIGEGRYFYWIFFFAVPIYFYANGYIKSLRDYDKFFKLTYLIVTVNILILLVVELINGGRFFLAPENQEFARLADDRGIRFLGSEETFHLGVVVAYLIIDQYVVKRKSKTSTFLILFLFTIILFTKNRAALISVLFALILLFILEGKTKILLKGTLAFLGLLGLSFIMFPDLIQSILTPLQSVLNITMDDTGKWRLMVQAAAIQQGLQTPFFGQGFGGYFDYYVEILDQTITYPPHSAYIHLFQKAGVVGLIAYLGAIFSLLKENSKLKKLTVTNVTGEKYRLLIKVLLIAQIPYGFAYNFSVYLGIYIGMQIVLKKILVKRYSENIGLNAAC